MDTTKMTPLERRVHGRNLINSLTISNLEHVLPQLEKYVGKKIKLANGDKSKLFVVDLPSHTTEDGQRMRIHLKFLYTSLVLWQDITVKDREYEGGGYGVTYHNNVVEVGMVSKEGILEEVFQLPHIVLDYSLGRTYTAEEQKRLQDKMEDLQAEIRELQRQLLPNTDY